jgi:hypothetical protein
LHTSPAINNNRNYAFRFENSWLQEEDIEDVVVESWEESRELEISNKIYVCADKLQRWVKRKRMCFKRELAECEEVMERWRGNQDASNSTHFKVAQEKHARILVQEEAY